MAKEDTFDDLVPPAPVAERRGRGGARVAVNWTPELEEEILQRVAEAEPLTQICRDEHMPSPSAIVKHRKLDASFAARYDQAIQAGVAVMEAEILEIADDSRNDWEERERKNGDTYIALNTEAVMRSRLRVETRKWLLGVYSPMHRERSTQDVNLKGVVANVNLDDPRRAARALQLLQNLAERKPDADPDDDPLV